MCVLALVKEGILPETCPRGVGWGWAQEEEAEMGRWVCRLESATGRQQAAGTENKRTQGEWATPTPRRA